MVIEQIKAVRLLPVVVIEDVQDAVPLCLALQAGGLKTIEITFRTAAAPATLRAISKEFPDFLIGAGTVTTVDELHRAIDAGAKFALAPGMNPKVITAAQKTGVLFIPGIATPTEIEQALDVGCTTLKFFPASQLGGPAMINTLASVYGHKQVSFIPTGGINQHNALEYLHAKNVIAIGGSWMVAPTLLKAKDYSQITALSQSALQGLRS